MTNDQFIGRLLKRILVLDGAMGTMIMTRNLTEKDFRGERFGVHPMSLMGCNDVLVLTRPDLVYGIHYEYLEAGADIISTDTFNSNRLSLAQYALEGYVREICRAGATIARKAVNDYCIEHGLLKERGPLVAGSVGPSRISLSAYGKAASIGIGFAELADAFEEQVKGLIEGGVDLILLETVFDLINAEAAVKGIEKAFKEMGTRLPIVISFTLTPEGRLRSGQTLKECTEALSNSGAMVFGLNCSIGGKRMAQMVEEIAECSRLFVSVSPNAGMPDEKGYYGETPDRMRDSLRPILEKRLVNIVGGCCGTTPEHIRLIAEEAKRYAPKIYC
ncbi:MAG: 5-methyltetrahydrofolate--homocysteine methyltransferase [Bacteroides sp.]|nr:5-methyltetrahydrofolate--homocysteine methyltransferase [Bacteroides sp.]